MTRSKKKRKQVPCFTFTPVTLHITQRAMKLFEQALRRAKSQPARVTFAQETMKQVNGKLAAMSGSAGFITGSTAFDYNERIVLATAIRLYAVDLLATPSHAQREEELAACWQIERFALGNLKLDPVRTAWGYGPQQ